MSRKIAGFISVCELIMAIVMYFAIAYHFDNDPSMLPILANINFEATLLRLMIYIVPGINIICGLFGIVFTAKGLLIFTELWEIAAGILVYLYRGQNAFIGAMAITMIVMGILFIICVIFAKTDREK